MSDILVAFATKAGSTEQVAAAIAEALRKSGHTVDLRRARDVREPASRWGCIVLGAPIYSGRWHRDAHRFLKRHRGELERVPVAIFAMGPRSPEEQAWQRSRSQLDRALAKRSWLTPAATVIFGGADPPNRRQTPGGTCETGRRSRSGPGRSPPSRPATRPQPLSYKPVSLGLGRSGRPPIQGAGDKRADGAGRDPQRPGCLPARPGPPAAGFAIPARLGRGPMIDGPLVSLAAGCGFRVSTFDPPGQYRSTRPARVSLDEMLECATETLGTLRLPARVAVIGHSMSALCASYLGLAHPDRVAKLLCRCPADRPRVAAEGAAIQAGDVIDDELSRAVVAYIRGAGLAWPHRSLDAVAGAMGADAAERLGSHLKRLADEAVYWPVDWDRHDALGRRLAPR